MFNMQYPQGFTNSELNGNKMKQKKEIEMLPIWLNEKQGITVSWMKNNEMILKGKVHVFDDVDKSTW